MEILLRKIKEIRAKGLKTDNEAIAQALLIVLMAAPLDEHLRKITGAIQEAVPEWKDAPV